MNSPLFAGGLPGATSLPRGFGVGDGDPLMSRSAAWSLLDSWPLLEPSFSGRCPERQFGNSGCYRMQQPDANIWKEDSLVLGTVFVVHKIPGSIGGAGFHLEGLTRLGQCVLARVSTGQDQPAPGSVSQ